MLPLPRCATPYEQHRRYVLAVLARRYGWLDPSDREALFHDAYAVFLEKQRAGLLNIGPMRPAQGRAYLNQTALNKAMDEAKRAGRRLSVSLEGEEVPLHLADMGRDLDELLAASMEGARLREILAELPARQQRIGKLRFFLDRTPAESQCHLGVTKPVYRRDLENGIREIAARFERGRNGTFCGNRRSLVLAYVTGIAGPRRMTEARRSRTVQVVPAG